MSQIGEKRRREMPKDSVFWQESSSVQRGWVYADMLLDKPPAKMVRWMKKEAIDEVRPRTEKRYAISRRLKKAGVWGASSAWRQKTIKEMQRWNYEKLTLPAARELVWRMVEGKVPEFEKDVRKAENAVAEVSEDVVSGMEFLPGWMRWCVLHPGLMYSAEQVMEDTTLDESCQRYLELYPCPHQAAMNQFMLYRGDKKLTDGLFKEIGRLHTAAIRAGGAEDANKASEETVEKKSIKTLKDILRG